MTETRSTRGSWQAQLLLFPLGALIGTLGDQIHVQFHVLSYPRPFLVGQAFWVPLLFGAAGVWLVNSHTLGPLRPRATGRRSVATCAVPFFLFALAYLATGLFQNTPIALTAGLTLAWLVRLGLAFSLDKLLIGSMFAVGGPLFEGALSSTGAFSYFHPDAFHVPMWLPALYLHVSLMTRAVYLTLFAGAPSTATPP